MKSDKYLATKRFEKGRIFTFYPRFLEFPSVNFFKTLHSLLKSQNALRLRQNIFLSGPPSR